VGYRRGCLPELIDEGRTGLLVDPDDEDALLACLTRAWELSPADCRTAAAARFTPAVMAQRYLRLYDTVLDRTRPAFHVPWAAAAPRSERVKEASPAS
jgi:glycogen synthase